MLTSALIAVAVLSDAACAQSLGGRGGDGNAGAAGGAGGTFGNDGAIGADGGGYYAGGGGGGGAAAAGGAGGAVNGNPGSAGGVAGSNGDYPTMTGGRGGDATNTGPGSAGGGGGGGGNGIVVGGTWNISNALGGAGGTNTFATAGGGGGSGGYGIAGIGVLTLNVSGNVSGGNGGAGGDGVGTGGGGVSGSGGTGGGGVYFGVDGSTLNLLTGGSITGGTGGAGGTGGRGPGAGGMGGNGVDFIRAGGNAVTVAAGATIQGGNGGATGLGGAGISGAGITIVNNGTIAAGLSGNGQTLANAITFTGGDNYLALSGLARLVGDIAVNDAGARVHFMQGSDVTLSSAITGAGGIVQAGSGTLTLTGASTYSGTTTISGGVLKIQNRAALGSAAGGTIVAAGAALQLQGNFDVTSEALTLNGTGINDSGALQSIAGRNRWGGGITLGSSSLIAADAGANLDVMSISGINTNATFGGAGAVWANGSISLGTGSLTKEGAGNLWLYGTNAYTGVTIINGGTLIAMKGAAIPDESAVVVNASALFHVAESEMIGSLAGAGNVSMRYDQTITTGRDNTSTTFSGSISGIDRNRGNLTKIGSGTFTLTGINSYSGTTTVYGGTLSVRDTGSIASSSMTTVNAGATLAGNGTVGNTTINGGTLAPGNSIGTLTVQGNLSFTAASSYMVEVSPTNADRVNVTGTATLGGATVNAHFAAGSYVEKQYTIVNATGGVVGKFGAQVNTDLPSTFKSRVSYDANNAYLDLALSFDPPVPPPGPTPSYKPLNSNQAAVGNALVGYFNRTGGIPLVFGALDAKGLTQASGELGTGSQQTTFDAMNMFMGVMTDPFAAGRSDSTGAVPAFIDEAMAYAGQRDPSDAFASMQRKAPPTMPVFQERWHVWAAGFGGSRSTDGNAVAGSNGATSSLYGTAVGADYWFSPNTIAGFSLAGGGTSFSVNGGGSGRSDLFQAGAFVRHTVGSAYVSAAAAYGWQDITTDRTVAAAGFERLRANFNANSYAGRVEVGNRFVTSWLSGVGLTPYGAVQVTAFDLPSHAEGTVSGANTFALAYAGKTATTTRTELGLRSDKSFALNNAILTLRGRAAWAYDFNSDRSATATFQTLPGASFVVNGAAQARNAALTTASAEMKWMNGWSVAATFEGEFSDVTRSYGGKGVVRYAW